MTGTAAAFGEGLHREKALIATRPTWVAQDWLERAEFLAELLALETDPLEAARLNGRWVAVWLQMFRLRVGEQA